MDIFNRAIELGKGALERGTKAYESARQSAIHYSNEVREKFSKQIAGIGFGDITMRALDSTSESMLTGSLKLLNALVRRLSEKPRYHFINDPVLIDDLHRTYGGTTPDNVTKDMANLLKLRAVFSNSWKFLDFGRRLNDYLNAASSERISRVVEKLRANDTVSDADVIAVLKALERAGIQLADADDLQLHDIALQALNEEEHYYRCVYLGLAKAQAGELVEAEKILNGVENRPHYLVHKLLADLRVQNDPQRAILNIETARECRPGDATLYEDRFAAGDQNRLRVFAECRDLLRPRQTK